MAGVRMRGRRAAARTEPDVAAVVPVGRRRAVAGSRRHYKSPSRCNSSWLGAAGPCIDGNRASTASSS